MKKVFTASGINNKQFVLLLLVISGSLRLIVNLLYADQPNIDLQIYRSAGALTINGINPYDFQIIDGEIADKIRTDKRYYDAFASQETNWPYYVSSNPPLSVLAWAALEKISPASGLFFRVFFSFFDLVIFLQILYLFKITNKKAISKKEILGIGMLCIFNPLVFRFGTYIPEDKQIQTSLILCFLMVILGKKERIFTLGIVCSFLILFKAIGFFLIIAALTSKIKFGLRHLIYFISGIVIPLLISLYIFGSAFIHPLLRRFQNNSGGQAIHDSIWVLFEIPLVGKIITATAISFIGIYFAIKFISDKAIFICLWLTFAWIMLLVSSGSWDRQLVSLLPVYIYLYISFVESRLLIVMQFFLVAIVYEIVHFMEINSNLIAGPVSSLLSILLLVFTILKLYFFQRSKSPTEISSN